MPSALEGLVREVLVAHLRATTSAGERRTGAPSSSRALREDELVEVGQRDDEVDVVLDDEARRAAARSPGRPTREDELVAVGVVERRRQAVDVGRDRRRAGPAEGRDDVDALPGAGEEDRRHGERA